MNVASLPKLFDQFHIRYNEQGLHNSADPAVDVLALVLLHEVGHIFLRDGHTLEDRGDLSKLRAVAGGARLKEVDPDIFVGYRFRAARSFLDDPHFAQRSESRAKLVERVKAALAVQGFLLSVAVRDLRPSRLKIMSPSHLDLDLRLYLLFELFTEKVNLAGPAFAIQDRVAEDKYNRALGDVPHHPSVCCSGPYEPQLSLLRDPDPDVRDQAAGSLALIKPLPPELLPYFLDALEEKYGEVPHIAYRLTWFGKLAVQPLSRLLSDLSKSPRIRERAAFALAGMRPENNVEALPALVDVLSDASPLVQHWAKLALSGHRLCEAPKALAVNPSADDAGPPCKVTPEQLMAEMRSFQH